MSRASELTRSVTTKLRVAFGWVVALTKRSAHLPETRCSSDSSRCSLVQLRLGSGQRVQGGELVQHRVAILAQEIPAGEAGTLAHELDIAHVPGDIAEEEEFRAVRSLHIDHLAARRVAGTPDQHNTRR